MDVAHKILVRKGNYLHMCHQQGNSNNISLSRQRDNLLSKFHFGNVECVQTNVLYVLFYNQITNGSCINKGQFDM